VNVAHNQHRWKDAVSEDALRVLEDSAKRLKWAWAFDKKDPKLFPINTDYVFAEIEEQLSKASQGKSRIRPQPRRLPTLSRPPKSFSALVDEKTIKAVYEQQNNGSYEGALKLAASGERKGTSAWRKIWLAANDAYLIRFYGIEFIPRPRVQFLHRRLLEIADATGSNELADEGINKLTHAGIAEFLDDLCPCGKKHKAETIRKLRRRWTGGGRAKP
jgi:hypothetical protein